MNKVRGFSIIELMIVIVIIAIGIGLAIPSFRDLIERKAVSGASEAAYEMLQRARSQALKRSKPIVVDFNLNGTSWAIGLTDDMSGCNAEDDSGSNACDLDYDNSLPGTVRYLMRIQGIDFKDITMSQQAGFANPGGVAPTNCTTSNNQQACFDFIRGLARTGAYQFESANYKLQVEVTQLGHVKVCIPTGEKIIVGYDYNCAL